MEASNAIADATSRDATGMLAMDDKLYKEALARRAALLDELKKLENFIRAYDTARDLIGGQPSLADPATPEKRRRNPIPPSRIADLAEELIRKEGRPLNRSELVQMFDANGIPLAGVDRVKNLGTIMWRNSDRFRHIEGRGYWIRGEPIPDA